MIEIKSNELKKYIESIVKKKYDKIELEDLERIEKIILKKINVLGKYNDLDIKELLLFKNLSSCSLFKFDISENDINILNQLEKLNYIYFDFCRFNIETLNLSQNNICFNMCEHLDFKYLKNTLVKEIRIIGDKNSKIEIDIKGLERALNLEKLYIHNFKIQNIEQILEIAPNLKKLNIDGSIVENGNILRKLEGSIVISNKKEYHLIGA